LIPGHPGARHREPGARNKAPRTGLTAQAQGRRAPHGSGLWPRWWAP
jgi:hypothetical protein